jgi:hypothetical protein
LRAGFRERLARKSSAEEVVRWDLANIQFPDIAGGLNAEVRAIERTELRVDLTREYAGMSQALEREVESPESSEQVDEPHRASTAMIEVSGCSASGRLETLEVVRHGE